MDPMGFLNNLTSEDVQRYTRIALQWGAAALVTHGMAAAGSSWIEPGIGLGVSVITFAWTLYGNRLKAKIAEIAKSDAVHQVVLSTPAAADSIDSSKVVSK